MRERFRLAARDTFRSLENRNFRLFFAGQFVSQTGTWLTMIATTLLVYDLTGSATAVGFLTACQFGPVLLLGAWAGLVADRSDKRRLLMIVQVGSMAKSLALAGFAFLDQPPIVALFLISAAGGVATAFDNPTRRSFVVEMVSETDVQNAVSINSALMTSSRIFGPALAGVLIATVGYGWTFLVDGLSYLAVLYGLWLIDPSKLRSGPVAPRGRGQVRAGLRYLRQVPVLWASMVIMAIVGTLTFNFQVVFPDFVQRTLGGDDTDFALLFSVTSIGSLAGALATARRTTVELRDVIVTAALYGVAMAALGLAPNLLVAHVVALFVGFTSIAFLTTATAIVQLRADPVMRGRVLALQAMVFIGSTPIGGPILGAICDAFGARAGIAIGAAGALGAAWLGVVMGRRIAPQPPLEGDVPLVSAG